jgi:hypothetical protein
VINLIINYPFYPEQHWTVTHLVDKEIVWQNFNTAELAADFLKTLGLDDDAIDAGLIEIYGNKHSRAIFSNGQFSHSLES